MCVLIIISYQFIRIIFLRNRIVAPEVKRNLVGNFGKNLQCVVSRAYPTPQFIWQYQEVINCSKISNDCLPSEHWMNISSPSPSLFKVIIYVRNECY